MTEWMKSFIEMLGKLVDKPPYLFFVFIAAVFTIISLFTKFQFEKTWVFFIYCIGGVIWRYIERDFFVRPLELHPKKTLAIHIVYHIGNILLFVALLHYLGFITIRV